MTEAPRATRGLGRVSVGVVPIVWNNVDLVADAPIVPADTVLDEIARLGYDGCQYGRGFPRGAELRAALDARGLRLAEVYVALPTTATSEDARSLASEALTLLTEADGDVLVIALGAADSRRDAWSGRASSPDAPRLDDAEWRALGLLLDEIGGAAAAAGKILALHPHVGTYLETPDELSAALGATSPELVGVCVDTGHVTVGGGDAAALIRAQGTRVRHVHVKDVDPDVLRKLRAGELSGFLAAIEARIFTELGSGLLDLDGVLAALERVGYEGWLMVEQDTTWLRPSEAAAIGRRVLGYAMRRLAGTLAA